MKVRVDRGPMTFVPVCQCGWRGLPGLTHAEALREARHHEQRAHAGSKDVLRALNNYRHRHGHAD